jgi:hypothetical protein
MTGMGVSIAGISSSKQRYGSLRITCELQSLGYKISRITVEKYMKELGLKKIELFYRNKLITKDQMELKIFEYIEIWHNKKRRHSALQKGRRI